MEFQEVLLEEVWIKKWNEPSLVKLPRQLQKTRVQVDFLNKGIFHIFQF